MVYTARDRAALFSFDSFGHHVGYLLVILAVVIYAVVMLAFLEGKADLRFVRGHAYAIQYLAELREMGFRIPKNIAIEDPSPQKSLFIAWKTWQARWREERLWFKNIAGSQSAFWGYIANVERGIYRTTPEQYVIRLVDQDVTSEMLQCGYGRSIPGVVPKHVALPPSAGRSGSGVSHDFIALNLIECNKGSLPRQESLLGDIRSCLSGVGCGFGRFRLFASRYSQLVRVGAAFLHFFNHALGGIGILKSGIGVNLCNIRLVAAYSTADYSDKGEYSREQNHPLIKLYLGLFVILVAALGFTGLILKLIEATVKNGNSAFIVNYFAVCILLIVGQIICYLILRKILG
jgi:hypothetical protein